jgi:hypothetical protein
MAETNIEQPKKGIRVGKSTMREAKNPEPIEKITKGIVYWGKDNLYPNELVSHRQDNPIHGGIINQKVTFMCSAGIDILGMEEAEAKKLEAIIKENVDDFETFNGFAILFKKVGEKYIPETIDFECVRFMEKENWFAISDDWSAKSQSLEKTNYREVKDIAKAVLTGPDADTQLLLYARIKPKQRKLKNGKLSLCYYPVPNYVGATTSILAGIEQDYFTYSESVNGYKGGTLVSMNNGEPETDEKADEIANKIKGEATERDKQGGITVVFADGGDNAATVTSMNGNDLDKRYIESNKEIRSKILVGHSAGSPTLFAVNSEGLFGSKEEMETAYTLFANNYIKDRHNFMSSRIEWAFARLGRPEVKIQFKKYVLVMSQEADDDNRTLRQLNSMGPLVATKVLDSMTQDEIRQLAKLGESNAVQMSSHQASKILVSMLSRIGIERNEMQVIKSRPYDFTSSDEDFLKEVEQFAKLSTNQQLILKLIQDGKTFSEISKTLGKGALYLSLELLKLNASGDLRGWKIVNPSSIALEVRYSYEVKSGMGKAIIETTRDFCRDMIELDRLYTRAEIEKLSAEIGTDVWRYRGGWYTNPGTGRTTPSCRHEWRQNIVKK